MDKRYLTPLELLGIATQQAYTADFLMQQLKGSEDREGIDFLYSITSLIYSAFHLTLQAYALHEQRPIRAAKKWSELVELNAHLGLSAKELGLLKTLGRQQLFQKGISYDLWENQQQLQVFCEDLLSLYERLQKMMPLELDSDYQV